MLSYMQDVLFMSELYFFVHIAHMFSEAMAVREDRSRSRKKSWEGVWAQGMVTRSNRFLWKHGNQGEIKSY